MYPTTPSKDDISALKNTTQNVRSTVLEAADDVKKEVRGAADKASRKVMTLIHNASDELVHARDSVTSQIRNKPMQSSAIALGIGFVLGALLRR